MNKRELKKKILANPLRRLLTAIKINTCIGLSHPDTFISNTNQSVTLELSLSYCSWAQPEVRSPRPSGPCSRAEQGRAKQSSQPHTVPGHSEPSPASPGAPLLPWRLGVRTQGHGKCFSSFHTLPGGFFLPCAVGVQEM